MLKKEQDFKLEEALPIVKAAGDFLESINKECDTRGLQKKAVTICIGMQFDESINQWQAAMGAVGTGQNIQKAAEALFDHESLGHLLTMVAANVFLAKNLMGGIAIVRDEEDDEEEKHQNFEPDINS